MRRRNVTDEDYVLAAPDGYVVTYGWFITYEVKTQTLEFARYVASGFRRATILAYRRVGTEEWRAPLRRTR